MTPSGRSAAIAPWRNAAPTGVASIHEGNTAMTRVHDLISISPDSLDEATRVLDFLAALLSSVSAAAVAGIGVRRWFRVRRGSAPDDDV